MKKILSLLVLLPMMIFSQSKTENYIKTTTYKVPTITAITNPTINQANQNITYFDGLGRPIQQVAYKQSGLAGAEKDIVTPIAYDGFGRQDKDYLPYVPSTTASMNYIPTALTDALSYYDATKYDADFPGMTTANINPYSQKEFEASPLNRVLKQAAPGKDWKLGNGHEIRLDYQTNTNADQVKRFGVSFIGGNTEAPYLEDNGIYDPPQLYKTITKDENWSSTQTYPKEHTTEEFKDKEGRVILKRTFDNIKWLDTYYVYDDYGNLTYVLPPKVFTYSSLSQNFEGQYTYRSTESGDMNPISTDPSEWIELYITKNGEDSLYFNISGYIGQGSVLQSGLVSDLDFTPSLPNMTLGNIILPGVNGDSVVAGEAYIENGNLYFSSTGAEIYPYGEYPPVTIEFTINLSSHQANFIPAPLDRATLEDLIYQYKYDYRNRLVEKKLPGKQWEYIVYDKLDRVVLTQDALLRTANKWLFTKYDAFSRPVYTGEYINTTVGQTSRAGVQALANASSNLFENKQGVNTVNGTTVYYSNIAFPNVGINLFTINYYDDYSFDLNGGGTALSYNITPITNAKGLATGSKVRVLGTPNWITNVSYYDDKSRPIYSYSKNDYLATTSTVKNQLDFVGKTLETTSTHQRSGVTTTVVDAFTYDQAGRLTKQTQAINGASIPEVIADNAYDELGQLTSKKVGGKTSTGLQTVDYAYNIRGWLTNINDPNNLNQDLFAFGLLYNTTSITPLGASLNNKPLYNGNIRNTSWKTSSQSTVLKWYNYTYDALNRLKAAIYVASSIGNNNKFNETITGYDRNGNIMGLSRNMQHPTVANSSVQIDNLIYTYDKGNKLLAVKDFSGLSTTGIEGFKDGTNTGNDYSYDANGNMTKDLNKAIVGPSGTDGITYNHLNLPTKITIGTGTIDYVYDATGVKQRKIVSPGITTDYAGGFQYESNILKFFPQPEGYVEYNFGTFNYIYQYKDHLGNVRLSYKNVGTTTTPSLQIVEESNYYPFGMKHKEINSVVTSTNPGQKYKYNGKELQDELGLNMYDYGARNYDPALGRWMNVDPLAETSRRFSPYAYALDNPVYYIDPDGMMATPPDDHFDMAGNFLYTDKRKSNNIVIDLPQFNPATLSNFEIKLSDYTFNSSNYSTLSKITEHYGNKVGMDMSNVKNEKISVGDITNVENKGSYIEGVPAGYNGGEYQVDDTNGGKTLMYTALDKDIVAVNLFEGKVDSKLDNKYNFMSVIDHEGGPIGHLVNPDKKHSDIYKDQISKYGKLISPDFLKNLQDNYKNYKKDGD
jgi:RHS repeat-associated protein